MKLSVIDTTGKKTKKEFDLNSVVFESTSSPKLLRQAIHVHSTNVRTGTAFARGRGEVSGTGRKPWGNNKQGRARTGDLRTPIFRGGGVSHGPVPMNYSLKLSKRMKELSLYVALTNLYTKKKVYVIEEFDIPVKSATKTAFDMISKIRSVNKFNDRNVIIFIEKDNGIKLGFRNIPNVTVLNINHINPYDIVNASTVIFTENAMEKINGAGAIQSKVVTKVKAEKSEKKVVEKVEKSSAKKVKKTNIKK